MTSVRCQIKSIKASCIAILVACFFLTPLYAQTNVIWGLNGVAPFYGDASIGCSTQFNNWEPGWLSRQSPPNSFSAINLGPGGPKGPGTAYGINTLNVNGTTSASCYVKTISNTTPGWDSVAVVWVLGKV